MQVGRQEGKRQKDMQVGRQYRTGKKGEKADGHAGGQAEGKGRRVGQDTLNEGRQRKYI